MSALLNLIIMAACFGVAIDQIVLGNSMLSLGYAGLGIAYLGFTGVFYG